MAVPVPGVESRCEAEPRWMTPRTPNRKTLGRRIAHTAQRLGTPFFYWQDEWTDVASEIVQDEETGLWVPAYPVAMATVMRQQGKTVWEFATYLDRGMNGVVREQFEPQNISYTAQSGSLARQKFENEHWPMLARSPLRSKIKRPRFAAEKAGLDFASGSHMTIMSNSKDAGHSLTLHMAVQDEIWVDEDRRRDQAADPAMLTIPDSQKLIATTAGTDASVVFLEKQAKGRASVDAGKDRGTAYLEYSADPKAADYDPEDPKLWRRVMPALTDPRSRLTESSVRQLMEGLVGEDGDMTEWERAGLNVTQHLMQRSASPISDILWAKVQDHKLEAPPVGALVLGVDSDPDGANGAVVAVDDGLRCELVEHRRGVSWLTDFLDASAARSGAQVAVDVGGPVAFLADRLEGRGVDVIRMSTGDVKMAAASFMERLAAEAFRVRPSSILDAAVESARKRKVGDGWSWDRYVGDISSLSALTLAMWGQLSQQSVGPLVWSA